MSIGLSNIQKQYRSGFKMIKKTLKDLGLNNESISVFRLRQWLSEIVKERICCPHCRKELEQKFNIK